LIKSTGKITILNTNRPPKNTLETKVTLKERFEALRNLPAFFKLVWQTSRWMTVVNALLRIVRSAMPLACYILANSLLIR
jgi:ATP-binding cassette subfamily B protein